MKPADHDTRDLDALMAEAVRFWELEDAVRSGEIGRDRVLRLVEVRNDASPETQALIALVRHVRRCQPKRKPWGEFVPPAGPARLPSGEKAFVIWALAGGFVDGRLAPSWFANELHWTAPVRERMAGLYVRPEDDRPVLAFQPFPADYTGPERLFRWDLFPARGPLPERGR